MIVMLAAHRNAMSNTLRGLIDQDAAIIQLLENLSQTTGRSYTPVLADARRLLCFASTILEDMDREISEYAQR